MKSASIIIIDDHVFVREGIEALLNQTFNDPSISSFSRIPEELDSHCVGVDLVICDYRVGDDHALSLLVAIARQASPPPVLVISMLSEEEVAPRCIAAGASGFISKAAPSTDFIAAVKMLMAGKSYYNAKIAKSFFSPSGRGGPISTTSVSQILSPRELQIFSNIGEGRPVSKIAERLGISVKTVETHRENIKNKLNIASAAEVLILASKWLSSGH